MVSNAGKYTFNVCLYFCWYGPTRCYQRAFCSVFFTVRNHKKEYRRALYNDKRIRLSGETEFHYSIVAEEGCTLAGVFLGLPFDKSLKQVSLDIENPNSNIEIVPFVCSATETKQVVK